MQAHVAHVAHVVGKGYFLVPMGAVHRGFSCLTELQELSRKQR